MSALYTRTGTEATPTHRDEKDHPTLKVERACGRCGGAGGSEKWRHTGWTCFDCGGSGKHPNGPAYLRLYTQEELDRLNTTKAKRDAKAAEKRRVEAEKRQAEANARKADFEAAHGKLLTEAETYLERSEFLRDVIGKARARNSLTENQEAAVMTTIARFKEQDAKRAASGYVGAVGERVTVKVTVERVSSFTRPSFAGYGTETVFVTTMRDEGGNAIVAMTSRFAPEKGEVLTIKATIKEHSEYNGEKQTKVQRVSEVENAG